MLKSRIGCRPTRAGPAIAVNQVSWQPESAGSTTVYNFEVQDDHTYFVGTGNGGVWVHNDCTSIANNFKNLYGGEVWRLSPQDGMNFVDRAHDPAMGGIPSDIEGFEPWSYHDVHVQDGMVRDPMMVGSNEPMSLSDWMTHWNNWDAHSFAPAP